MNYPDLFAQLAREIPALYTYGPLGVVCAFFMLVTLKVMAFGTKLIEGMRADNETTRKELTQAITEMGTSIRHQLQGLSRTQLIHILSQKNLHPDAERLAMRELERVNEPPSQRS